MQILKLSTAKRNLIFFSITLLILVADQLSKLWIRTNFLPGQSMPESGFFTITFVQNTGAVFGIFRGNNDILIAVAGIEALIIIFCFFYFRRRYPVMETLFITIVFGLIMAGVLGNLIDRIMLGFVTDFISVGPWPVFNIADSSGVVGILLLMWFIIRLSIKASPEHH